ncbi:MAG: response regulator transcription factor [Opitutae bacterium]|nr:response regulator transcription factor [Opitutae bacterium]
MKQIRVAVVGADQLMRDFLRQSLPAFDARFTCVRDLPCELNVAGRCRAASPDLVIFDMNSRSTSELTALRELAAPALWALLVIAREAPDHVLEELVTRKRSGFFSRNNSLDALARVAFLVALGGTYFDGPMHELLLRRASPPVDQPMLSQRERHVLQLVAEGHSTKEVAVILRLSTKTVDKYRTSVMQKLGVHDVVRLTHYAIRMGFVTVS